MLTLRCFPDRHYNIFYPSSLEISVYLHITSILCLCRDRVEYCEIENDVQDHIEKLF